jgi:hypothetical protein
LLDYDAGKLVDLASLPFVYIVTTNFDEAVLDAYAAARGRTPRLVNIDEPTLDAALYEKKFYVARIHGRVELASSMRLSREHFAALNNNESYKAYLTHVLTRCNVMFVGFSFLDPAITTVMRAVKATYKNLHGKQHLALLSSDAQAEFVRELETHDIRRVMYEPAGGHAELWRSISDALVGLTSKVRSPIVVAPFDVAKRYLATAYARMKLGASRSGPLLHVMAEGMVAGMIRNAQLVGISEAQLAENVFAELPVSKDSARTLVSRSVTALLADDMCKSLKVNETVRYVAAAPLDDAYNRAIDRLVNGTINRFLIREKGNDTVEIRQFLRAFYIELLLSRGWDLGAAFAARRMPEDVDVRAVMQNSRSAAISNVLLEKLTSSVEDLLSRPDDVEAGLLSELGRLSFGLELLIQSPRDSEFFERTLPERIYLDANVLMPAITAGHPGFYPVSADTSKKAKIGQKECHVQAKKVQ